MSVRSESTSTRGKASAIVTQAQLDRSRAHFERAIGLALLALSVAGSVIAFNGGWAALRAGQWTVNATIVGAGVQVLCTTFEWWWRRRRLSIPYVAALLIDAGTTVAGFGPLFHAGLAARIPVAPDLASWLAWGIIGTFALALAWVPEGQLID